MCLELTEKSVKDQRPLAQLLDRQDVDVATSTAPVLKLDYAIGHREERIVFTAPHILTWKKLRSALTNNDRPTGYYLAAIPLYAKILRLGVATIATRSLSLLMCHL